MRTIKVGIKGVFVKINLEIGIIALIDNREQKSTELQSFGGELSMSTRQFSKFNKELAALIDRYMPKVKTK